MDLYAGKCGADSAPAVQCTCMHVPVSTAATAIGACQHGDEMGFKILVHRR